MKNKKLMLVPIAVLSLGAVIGCNGNNGTTDSRSAIEKEIDEALVLPEKLESISRFEASALASNLRKGFANLLGVQSKNFTKTYYSNIYTGTYAKLVKDTEVSYEIETTRYDNAVGTISTKKHDVEIENGVSVKYDSSRDDLIYYKNGYAVDNITLYEPESFGEKAIGRQRVFDEPMTVSLGIKGEKQFLNPVEFLSETSEEEEINNFMNYFDQLKMGSDGRSSDLGYFFKQNDNNIYCVTFNTETTKVKNAINPSKLINQTTEEKTVMHFIKDGTQWLSKSYASSSNVYYDRDLNDNIFTTPVLVNTSKFASHAKYGVVSSYSLKESIVDPTEIAGESIVESRLKLSDDAVDEDRYQYDSLNSFSLFDVTPYAQSIKKTEDYVFTVVDGYDVISRRPKRAKAKNANAASAEIKNGYKVYDALYMLTNLYVDNYITQRNSYLEYKPVYLSKIRKYNFHTHLDEFIPTENYELDPISTTGVALDDEGSLTVPTNGYYYVTVNVTKDLSKATLKVELQSSIVDNDKENNYYNVSIESAQLDTQLGCNIYIQDYYGDVSSNDDYKINEKVGTYRAFNYIDFDDDSVQEHVVIKAENEEQKKNYIMNSGIQVTGASYTYDSDNGIITLGMPNSTDLTIKNIVIPSSSIGDKTTMKTAKFRWSTSGNQIRINGTQVDGNSNYVSISENINLGVTLTVQHYVYVQQWYGGGYYQWQNANNIYLNTYDGGTQICGNTNPTQNLGNGRFFISFELLRDTLKYQGNVISVGVSS